MISMETVSKDEQALAVAVEPETPQVHSVDFKWKLIPMNPVGVPVFSEQFQK